MTIAVSASSASRLRDLYRHSCRLTTDTEPHLANALRETLQQPGNMIRAELAFRLGRAYDLPDTSSEPLAIAVEYFHTASLLFDDLPCMDNAELRRGAPCIHHIYGEGAAILAALALINHAYGLLWRGVAHSSAEARARALEYVEHQLGIAGVLNGQSRDLHMREASRQPRVYQQIAIGKTVSLIRMALVAPAIAGGASEYEQCLLDRLAIAWGLSYQILDDLKDVLHTAKDSGKTAARDQKLQRPNLALTIGVNASLQRVQRLVNISERLLARIFRQQNRLLFLRETLDRFRNEMATMAREAPAPGL
jgi:geranylgeranyl diphosphate synthase type II